MHFAITAAVATGAALLIGCAEPLAPAPGDHATTTGVRGPKDRWPAPDSVRIPPSPIPPIYEEVPIEAP